METGNVAFFDLPKLFKKGNLNIKYIAEKHMLSAKEYFELLLDFLNLAPDVSKSLKRFISIKHDIEDYKTVNSMAELLKDLGADNLITPFYTVLGAYDTGNWRLAATHAERLLDQFDELHVLVKEAQRMLKREESPIAQEPDLLLKAYMQRLDEEEASRKLIILAVDDSPVILKSVASVLGGEYKVFTLPKPEEIEKVLARLTPDLFLLDYKMPEINGFDLIPIIRNFEEHKETPIIFLTSEGTMDHVTAAMALGACDFAVKPFNPDGLRQKIAKHIKPKNLFK